MTLSIKAEKKVTVRRFAKAAVVAALLSTLLATLLFTVLSTRGADQGTGGAMDMPANCGQNLNQCSLKVWPLNTFPKSGVQRSFTFTNGQILTCSSNGPNTTRSCELSPPPRTNANADPHSQAVRQQCAELKQELRTLTDSQDRFQSSVGREGAYLAQVMQMTPAMLDAEIKQLQESLRESRNKPVHSVLDNRQEDRESAELNFVMDLRANQVANQAFGPGTGATTEQMQARAKRLVNDQRDWADDQQRGLDTEIKRVGDKIANLDCANVPLPAGTP